MKKFLTVAALIIATSFLVSCSLSDEDFEDLGDLVDTGNSSSGNNSGNNSDNTSEEDSADSSNEDNVWEDSEDQGGDTGSDTADSGSDTGNPGGDQGDETGDSGTEINEPDTEIGDSDIEHDEPDTETGDVDKETGDVDTETGDVDTETGDADTETGDVDTETGDADTETGDVDTETGDVDTETGDTDTETGDADTETGDADTETGDADVVEDPCITITLGSSLTQDTDSYDHDYVYYTTYTPDTGGEETDYFYIGFDGSDPFTSKTYNLSETKWNSSKGLFVYIYEDESCTEYGDWWNGYYYVCQGVKTYFQREGSIQVSYKDDGWSASSGVRITGVVLDEINASSGEVVPHGTCIRVNNKAYGD